MSSEDKRVLEILFKQFMEPHAAVDVTVVPPSDVQPSLMGPIVDVPYKEKDKKKAAEEAASGRFVVDKKLRAYHHTLDGCPPPWMTAVDSAVDSRLSTYSIIEARSRSGKVTVSDWELRDCRTYASLVQLGDSAAAVEWLFLPPACVHPTHTHMKELWFFKFLIDSSEGKANQWFRMPESMKQTLSKKEDREEKFAYVLQNFVGSVKVTQCPGQTVKAPVGWAFLRIFSGCCYLVETSSCTWEDVGVKAWLTKPMRDAAWVCNGDVPLESISCQEAVLQLAKYALSV